MNKPRRLRRFLWRVTVALCVAAWLGTLGLGAASYKWPRQWDLSIDGECWRFVYWAEAGVTVSYAARDEPPLSVGQDPVLRSLLRELVITLRGYHSYLWEPNFAEYRIAAAKSIEELRTQSSSLITMIAVKDSTLGFFIHTSKSPATEFVLRMPLWPLLIVFAIAPMITWRGRRRRLREERRRRSNRCVACDYDLTGNVSGVCSECGTRVQDEECKVQN